MASPLGRQHGYYSIDLIFLLELYLQSTPGVELLNAATTILGEESEPEPDLSLRILPEYGGQSRTTRGRVEYIAGAPELVVEVSHSRVAIDLHQKRDDYLAAGVLEYLVVCVEDQEIHWFDFVGETTLEPDRQGVTKSLVFPGLWLDGAAFLRRDKPRTSAVMQKGLASRPHAAFVKRLAARKRRPDRGAP
jgi:Uma2 family endonuclease